MTSTSMLTRRHSIPELSPHQELALLARVLWREGYNDHAAGHMTYRQPDGTFLALPEELGWNEICASDVIRIDEDGNLLEGDWTVPPPIILHTEYHKMWPGTDVTLHHHPKYATPWSTAGALPGVYDQRGALLPDSAYVLYDDYDGTAAQRDSVRRLMAAVGDARCVLLRNHGVFVVGDNIDQAWFHAYVLEGRCRQAWMVKALGLEVDRVMPDVGRRAIEEAMAGFGWRLPRTWEWAVRQELRDDPGILD